MKIRVGILDTGIVSTNVVAAANFLDDSNQKIDQPTSEQHGSQLANIVLANAQTADLLDARAISAGHPSSPEQIAKAIDWLIEQDAHIINMSFALESPSDVLSTAIARAQAAGIICVASAPAQGVEVYPATYNGVISVSGDARCSAGEFSLLQDGPDWYFGAANGGAFHRAHQRGSGASFACAHVSGALAQLLITGLQAPQLFSRFADHCFWNEVESRKSGTG